MNTFSEISNEYLDSNNNYESYKDANQNLINEKLDNSSKKKKG